MELTLQRRPTVGKTTIGDLSIDGVRFCFTLEDVVREVEGKAVSSWKIKGETAIPVGRYKVSLVNSSRFGPDTFSLEDVPGFESIRIHSGNTNADTEGCILVGESAGDELIGMSRVALAKLKEKLTPAIKAGEPVFVTVSSC